MQLRFVRFGVLFRGSELKDALRVELCCGAQFKDLSIHAASSVSAHKKRGTVIAFLVSDPRFSAF